MGRFVGSPKREWKNSTLLAVHAPPASPGWVSGKTENFLVFFWFSFVCFHHSPQEIVHVGQSLPEENEVICSFLKKFFVAFSFNTSHPASALSPPRKQQARQGGVGWAGVGMGRGANPTGRGCCQGLGSAPPSPPRSLPSTRSLPPPPRPTPLPPSTNPGNARKVSSREGRPRSGAARSANNNSK